MGSRISSIEIKNRLSERKIKLLGEYLGKNIVHLFECEFGHVWETTGMSVIYAKNGCTICSNTFRHTKETINSYLISKNSKISLVGEYVNNITRTKFYCSGCCNYWETTWQSIMNSKYDGCKKCGYTNMRLDKGLTKQHLNVELASRQIEMMDEYTHIMNKSKFRCLSCFGIWEIKVNDVINVKNGCPTCSKTGFKVTLPAYVYLLKFDTFIKYGITNNLKKRIRSHRRNGNFEIIGIKFYEVGQDALNWERGIKKKFGGRFATKDQCPDGFTETLDISLPNEVKSTL